MLQSLPSYVNGAWFTPSGGDVVVDASTGEAVTAVSSDGIDFAAATHYARGVGGPALRAITFRRRAALIEALGKQLRDRKQEFYDASARAGSTKADAAFDVEGGVNALFVLAKKGKTELPEDTIWLEGDPERLSKQGSFVAQHILTPRRGLALHINAFNFPVWGLLAKLAPAILAGVPVLTKPATPTAYVAQAVVRAIVDANVLPEGALQLICGSIGGLLDHLTEQDVIAFTGSAPTARKLRTHPTVVERSVRLNTETDSLNAAILGPDAAPDSEELALFLRELTREITQKAGQKCTAVRRAFVPRALAPVVLEGLRDKLSAVRVGQPDDEQVTMGPLVSLDQRTQVRKDVEQLTRSAEIAYGSFEPPTDLASGDAEKGAFLSPILLWCEDPTRPEPHEIEPFGPVCTVMPYDSLAEVAALAARGGGSLVATLVTHDPAVARQVTEEIAAWHGRLLILDPACAGESTGHGAALAQLVHGGPGRAGDGEELGGLRSLHLYLQRTALQGSPDMLTALTRRWVTGAQRHVDGHPFRKYLDDIRLGDAVIAGPRQVTLADIEHFAEFTGDIFYAHMDEDAARANPFFEGRVAHGYLIVAFAAGLFVEPAPGPVLANYGVDRLRFVKPVYAGDTLTVTLTAKEIRPRRGYGEVSWDAVVTNQDEAVVAEYDVLTMVANRPAEQ